MRTLEAERRRYPVLKKKLLTAVCVLGILACGACFLPPLPENHPPTPPPLRTSQGIHSIRVEATNTSKGRHLDGPTLAQEVVNSINWRSADTAIKAHTSKNKDDAVLAIDISNETANLGVPTANQSQVWEFQVNASATLTAKDGTVIWSAADSTMHFSRAFSQQDPAELWSDPAVQKWLGVAASGLLVYHMFLEINSNCRKACSGPEGWD